ncbi:MAG TPA: hypothetical protein VGP72_14710 [Planctomycetota bacterium]|jgi:hypothetical protein
MTLSLADWAKTISDPKGQADILQTTESLQAGWPLLKILPFRPEKGQGFIANFVGRSAQAATRAMNAEFTESSGPITDYTFTKRAAGGAIKLDVNQIDSDPRGTIRGILMTEKLRDIGARLNRMWFTGDKADAGGAQWTGVNKLCTDLAKVIYAGDNGAVVTAAMMDALIALVPGCNAILCNRTLAVQIDGLNVGIAKYVVLNQGGITSDMFVPTYKGIAIIPIAEAPDDTTGVDTEILPFDEERGNSGAACSRITAARIGLDGLFGVHTDIFSLSAPRRAGAFETTDMNWFMAGLATNKTNAVAQLRGVKATA